MEIKNIICSMALVGSTVLTGCSTAPVVKVPLEYSIEMADAVTVHTVEMPVLCGFRGMSSSYYHKPPDFTSREPVHF